MRTLTRLLNDEQGSAAIEYGCIACLVSLAIIPGASSLGTQLSNTLTHLAEAIAAGGLSP